MEPSAGVGGGTRLGHGMGFRHGGISGKAGHCGHCGHNGDLRPAPKRFANSPNVFPLTSLVDSPENMNAFLHTNK
jgi:hypothetical protein